MTFAHSQHAKLHEIIRQARHLLFAFDGPIRGAGAESTSESTTTTAQPAPYIHDVLAACRESRRTAAIVTTTPAAEVRAYLDAHDLSTQIEIIAASIAQAVSALDASPPECVAITSSVSDTEAAQAAGVPAIAYAKTPDDAEHLVNVGAATFVYSMMDLTLRIRARS